MMIRLDTNRANGVGRAEAGRRMSNVRQRRGGFVIVTALMTMAVVVAAAGILSAGLRADFLRTQREISQAQLRELLLAGCQAARQRVADGDATGPAVAVGLPAGLTADGAALTVTPVRSNSRADATMIVDARYGSHRESERVRFHRDDTGWTLADVELDQ